MINNYYPWEIEKAGPGTDPTEPKVASTKPEKEKGVQKESCNKPSEVL